MNKFGREYFLKNEFFNFFKIRRNKRDEVLAKKRSLGGNNTAPFLVCLLPLNEQVDPRSALSILENCDPSIAVARSPSGVTHIT